MIPSPEHHKERVAIITGASQSIGAGLTRAYRELGYAVIATARSSGPSEDPGIVTVQGDIADPDTAPGLTENAFGRRTTGLRTSKPPLLMMAAPFSGFRSACA